MKVMNRYWTKQYLRENREQDANKTHIKITHTKWNEIQF